MNERVAAAALGNGHRFLPTGGHRFSPPAAALALALAMTPIACGDGTADPVPAAAMRPPAGWTAHAHADAERGFSLSLPSSWRLARRAVAPGLINPRERMAIATYPLRRWPCASRHTGRATYLDVGPVTPS